MTKNAPDIADDNLAGKLLEVTTTKKTDFVKVTSPMWSCLSKPLLPINTFLYVYRCESEASDFLVTADAWVFQAGSRPRTCHACGGPLDFISFVSSHNWLFCMSLTQILFQVVLLRSGHAYNLNCLLVCGSNSSLLLLQNDS